MSDLEKSLNRKGATTTTYRLWHTTYRLRWRDVRRRCYSGNAAVMQQKILQHCKTVCCAANDFAVLQNGLLCSKRFCSTAKRLAVQQKILQHCKTVCCAAKDFAALQNGLACSKSF